ncbi:MAG: SAM-dependent methyltransferase [Ramlibacter sp.]|nr:SAM-dependent methyltransferase [Ramlibacter sp.]
MRNPPERYLQTLHDHFAHAPQWFAPEPRQHQTARPAAAPITTNQDGKGTAFQRWFHFKEAFSPAFVSAAISSLGYRPKHVTDPFGGSGTTAITAQLLALDATTIEVNPFLADIIKAKVSSLSAEALRRNAADFQARLARSRPSLSRLSHLPATFIEAEDKERWIFPLAVAKRLSQYLTCIDAIEEPDVQRFFRVVLGAVLVDCSNVYVNGKGRRYRAGWQEHEPAPAMLDQLFGAQFNTAFEDVLRFEGRPRSRIDVIHGDARQALAAVTDTTDLVVFSPPYPNSFDYTDIYNVELWALGYLANKTDNVRLRNETLRSHVQIHRKYELPQHASPLLDSTLTKLELQREQLWDGDIPNMVGAYFRDIETILVQCQRILAESGKVMMVVGDSRYASVRIEVAAIIAQLAKSMGYSSVKTREVRQMRSSAQQGGRLQLAESIVELRP